ncbi:HU family DNA-binding protein [Candidatus Parcubacteria bacterium]|nr:MAG: HU family DNA-binding protein [Candidatus Parcubacteria bacterium]
MLDTVVEEITLGARQGGTLSLRPLGTFKMKHRNARKARNPRTGETIEVPARDVLTFKEAAQ